jgi:hypothetical protein
MMYSGRTHAHGFAYQAFHLPDGLIFLGGPFPGRYNDPGMFNETRVCRALAGVVPTGHFFIVDGIYSPLLHPWVHSTKLADVQMRKLWGHVRVSVEHAFANVVNHWVLVSRLFRVGADAPAKKYEVAVLLTNFLNFFVPNQTQQRFGLSPRPIEVYLAIASTHPVALDYY